MNNLISKRSRITWRLATLAAGVLGLSGQAAQAALAGAWETFFTQNNTDAWLVYDYADYPAPHTALWSGTPLYEEYAYYTVHGDHPLGFAVVPEKNIGLGAFLGDYSAQKIAGIGCDVFIGDLAALDFVDCTIYATSPYGDGWYYRAEVNFTASGWKRGLFFSLSAGWNFWNGTTWVAIAPTVFTLVDEIQINFTPKKGTSGGSRVGIDNVKLVPTVTAPVLATSVTTAVPRNFRLAFTPGPGLQCRVEKMQPPPATGWDPVAGQTGIRPPGEHVFLTPATLGREFFRVATEPYYELVITP